jgi:hypothetical protein
MKGRLTFLVITSKTGKQRRFSLHRSIIFCVVLVALLLLGSGIVGALKYKENMLLKDKCKLLEAEKNKLEAVARTVQDIEREEVAVRKMLGLDTRTRQEAAQ